MTYEDFKAECSIVEGRVGKPTYVVGRDKTPTCCPVSVVINTPHGQHPFLALYALKYFEDHDSSEAVRDLAQTGMDTTYKKYYGDD